MMQQIWGLFVTYLIYFTPTITSFTARKNILVTRHERESPAYFELRSSTLLSIPDDQSPTTISNVIPPTPTIPELLNFGLPTLGIWLLQPILSLIDSSIVGISATGGSITELAALGPAIIWCDGTAYLLQFMGMATTILYATAISEGDETKSNKVLSHAGVIAAVLGLALGVVQYVLAEHVLTLLSGKSAKEIVPIALKYVRIRSLGAPIALLTIVVQAAFLASKDSLTPLKAVLFGTSVNVVGDIVLVLGYKLGLTGAAVATMLSQVAGGLYLFYIVLLRILAHNQDIVSLSTFGARMSERYVHMPRRTDLVKFSSFAGPIFFVLFSKQVLWTYATVCASSSGTVGLAAHQVDRYPHNIIIVID